MCGTVFAEYEFLLFFAIYDGQVNSEHNGVEHYLLGRLQTPEHLKTQTCEEAFNPDGLAQRSIALLKDSFPDLEVRHS